MSQYPPTGTAATTPSSASPLSCSPPASSRRPRPCWSPTTASTPPSSELTDTLPIVTGMAYDEALAERVRRELDDQTDGVELIEKKMFGGLCFMVDGAMALGVTGTDLMVRVGKDAHTD